VDSPNQQGATFNRLNDVSAASANDAWAVGEAVVNNATFPLIMHWDGSTWTMEPGPTTISNYALHGVSATSAGEVWAVGYTIESDSSPHPLILHRHGLGWTIEVHGGAGEYGAIFDIDALSTIDAWAVGYSYSGGSAHTQVRHWIGGAWLTMPGTHDGILTAVDAQSSTNIWAVGYVHDTTYQPLMWHREGTGGTYQVGFPSGRNGQLRGVVVLSPSDVWAVGWPVVPTRGWILHYDGTEWSESTTPDEGGNLVSLNDIDASSAQDVWAVGNKADALLRYHWDGSQWSGTYLHYQYQNEYRGPFRLHVLNAYDMWAVGHAHLDSSPQTYVERYNSYCPPPTSTPTRTPTGTRTPTVTPIPIYTILPGTATIVPGTSDIGNHCDNCVTTLRLPFPVALYDRQFSSATVGSNGTIGFVANANPAVNICLPSASFDHALLPLWDDLDTRSGASCSDCGIYTSISGIAPNRIFNIEWRATLFRGTTKMDFEARLYENNRRIDFVYGRLDEARTETVGAQRDTGSIVTHINCNLGLEPGMENKQIPYTSPDDLIIDEGIMLSLIGSGSGPTPTPTGCPVQFSDLPTNHAFYPYIRCLACRGIISGYADGTFRPGNSVTRGQLAKMVSNAVGLNDGPGDEIFEDVQPGSTFYDFVQRLAARGYISGYQCGGVGEPCSPDSKPYFRPGSTATRGQVSKIVSNTASFEEQPTGQSFEDVPPGHAFYLWIERLSAHGIISGYECGGQGEPCDPENRPYFRPGNNVTRGQTAKIVANTYYPGCVSP
jgi:hypothetical protein